MSDQAYENTDRELWREGDPESSMSYYEPSIHVTADGGIGINVGGTVYVKTLREWHSLAGGPISLVSQQNPTTGEWEPAVPLQDSYRHWPWLQRVVDWLWRVKPRDGSNQDTRGA